MRFLDFFKDGADHLSSQRLVYVLWWFMLIFVVVWAVITKMDKLFTDTATILALTAMITGNKVMQSFTENASQKIAATQTMTSGDAATVLAPTPPAPDGA